VSNLGNVALPPGEQVNIQIIARYATDSGNVDIVLTTLSNQSVSGLGAGRSATFYAYVNRPAGLPADSYQILANIIPVQPLAESNIANNLVMLTASGLSKTIVLS
jgi:hypothetical protein